MIERLPKTIKGFFFLRNSGIGGRTEVGPDILGEN